MFRSHTFCRACGFGKPAIPTLKISTAAGPAEEHGKLIEILDLGVSALANDFKQPGQDCAGYAPLKLMWCPRCTLAQLSVVVDPEVLYSNYPYVTSQSATMMAHFEHLVEDLLKETKRGYVLEIGSNDGTLLEYCKKVGFEKVLGFEPASNLACIASKRGIQTHNAFFNRATANVIQVEGQPDLIIARHVFCHIDDWQDFIKGLELLCHKETVVAIEVPYFLDTVKNCEFDQCYHEHLSYMTIQAMDAALDQSSLHISKVTRYPIHGGAIVMLLRRDDSDVKPCPQEPETLTLDDLKMFQTRANGLVHSLSNTVRDLVAMGKMVVGYGASAKATQWIHACKFTRKEIKWVCDNTPQKQYCLMPGTEIPVVDPGALTRELPDYAVCFAWNFFSEISAKEQLFMKHGCQWIIPLPEVKIV